MMQLRKKRDRIMEVILCIILVWTICLPLQSEATKEAPTVLRVAYCPLTGFFDYDEQGNEIGYGVDILNKISQYTGISFEYIKVDSWEDTKYMLLDGEADIRMPGTMPSNPSTTLEYSSTSILDTYEVLLTLKSREDLYYQDYQTIDSLKVAIVDSFYREEEVEHYLDEIGLTESQFVFCSEYNECYDKLCSGEVDALITNIVDMTDDMKMLDRFNSVSNYISMVIDNPYMPILNDAIAEIKLEEPMFFSNLYEQWFPERVTIPFTIEESEYLASIDTLTFAFRKDEGYLSHYKDGVFYGIYVDQAKLICDKLGKDFQAVSLEECLDGTETADAYAGFFYDQNYAKSWDFAISTPIRDINYYIVQKKEENFDPKNCRIAAIQKFKYTSDYLQTQYPDADFQYYDTYEECLKAVENKNADMTIINNYIAEYYLGMYQYSDLSVQLSNDYSHMFCFAIKDDNELLASILSKGLSMVSDTEMSNTYITGQEDKAQTRFLEGMIHRNPLAVAVVSAVIVTMMLALAMLYLFTRKQRKQNIELEQALSAKSSFLARMSHDMRTPLNVIIGMDNLARKNDNPDDTNHCLEKIDIASEFMLGLVNDILDIERVNSGKTELHITPYSGEEFSQYIDAVITPLCQEKNISFEYSYSGPNDFIIMQDKLRINQIYFNLLSNAVKFTPEGGNITFHTDFEKTDHETILMKVTIADNGIGMSEEFQKHMFDAFTQENQTVTPIGTGTGLGLTIVKRMCDLMHMHISVQSKLGEGTAFTLQGEYEIAKDIPQKESNGNKKTDVNDFSILKNKTILICEDHPLNQEIIRRVLEAKGIIVSLAEDGKKGLETFKQSSPGTYDAILMDIRMPVMDGIQTTMEIRKLTRPDAQKVPIIALTANAYEEDVRKYMEAGMNDHMVKPIQPNVVYQMLVKYLS